MKPLSKKCTFTLTTLVVSGLWALVMIGCGGVERKSLASLLRWTIPSTVVIDGHKRTGLLKSSCDYWRLGHSAGAMEELLKRGFVARDKHGLLAMQDELSNMFGSAFQPDQRDRVFYNEIDGRSIVVLISYNDTNTFLSICK
jgi:hypothetical protein